LYRTTIVIAEKFKIIWLNGILQLPLQAQSKVETTDTKGLKEKLYVSKSNRY
jgi:hypothetical protein